MLRSHRLLQDEVCRPRDEKKDVTFELSSLPTLFVDRPEKAKMASPGLIVIVLRGRSTWVAGKR